MSIIKDCTTTKPPSASLRSNCFLGCFGYSGEKMQLSDEVKSGSRRRRWISKWKFHFKKSAVKTVPVDHTTVSGKSSSFKPSRFLAPATVDKTGEIQVVEEDATLTKKPVIMVCKIWPKSDTRQGWSCRSRREKRKTAAATATDAAALDHPGSPGNKSVTITHSQSQTLLSRTVVSSPLTRSISLPPPKEKKPPPARGGNFDKTAACGGEFDSLVGMSIILVILVMMLLWGKLFAILCTCAWFFVAPRLGTAGTGVTMAVKGRPNFHKNLDLDSVEYKKRVVLEGLLQRNHKNVRLL